jgi:hypothetical protein
MSLSAISCGAVAACHFAIAFLQWRAVAVRHGSLDFYRSFKYISSHSHRHRVRLILTGAGWRTMAKTAVEWLP